MRLGRCPQTAELPAGSIPAREEPPRPAKGGLRRRRLHPHGGLSHAQRRNALSGPRPRSLPPRFQDHTNPAPRQTSATHGLCCRNQASRKHRLIQFLIRRELAHASRQLTSIEINGTFYGTQKPDSFLRWADETPDDFVFSLKGPRYATHRRVLAEASPSIERFFASGVLGLKSKLGPILWQLPPTKAFDAGDFAAFLALLPKQLDGRAIRH